MMRNVFLFILILFVLAVPENSRAQEEGRMRIKNRLLNRAVVPFNLVKNLIIIPVRINNSSPLYFILDSGVRNTMITRLFASDTLEIKDAEKIDIVGHGEGEPLKAYRSKNNNLRVGPIVGENFEVNVLMYDIFHLSAQLGRKVHGIIGYDLLSNFVVLINYHAELLKFYPFEHFDKWWVKLFYKSYPMEIYNHKPYIKMWVKMHEDTPKVPVNMLMDTGSSETLWLFEKSQVALQIPERKELLFIGRGLNGNIYGWRSRIFRAGLGGHVLEEPIVAFPDTSSVRYEALRESRNGTIGANVLHRFNVILDYKRERVYLNRNPNFLKPFQYNSTGIVLYAEIPGLPVYRIRHVREDSHAAKNGIKEGDQVLELNGTLAVGHSLEEMNKLLNDIKPGEHVSMLIQRDGTKKRISFTAEDIIGNYRKKEE